MAHTHDHAHDHDHAAPIVVLPVTDLKKKELPGSLIELSGTIPAEEVSKKRDGAIKRLGADLELPGFRKGHVPAKMVVDTFGELAVLEEAAGLVLQSIIPELLARENVPIIAMPKVRITKLAANVPVEFSVTAPVMPVVKLPDYRKVAKKALAKLKEEKVEVTEQEVSDTVLNVRKTVTEWKKRKAGAPTEPAPADGATAPTPAEPPALTDEDVKLIGDYQNVADFTEKLRASLKEDKERKLSDKRRAAIAEALGENTKVDVPEVMIEDELTVTIERFRHDIENMHMKFEDYLAHLKKTVDDLKKEWREEAKKRVVIELALIEIAKAEKIEPPQEEVEHETKHYLEHVPDADEHRVRSRMSEVIRNQKVFELLEAAK